MAKKQKFIISSFIIAVLVALAVIYLWQKPIRNAHKQIDNYQAYQTTASEIEKVKINEKDFIYYYAADGKRYVFPDLAVFRSWFGDYEIDMLELENVEEMSKSPLGGNVTLRPGSLLQSQTLLETFIVIKDGLIKPVFDEKLLVGYYGKNWESSVIVLPDYYFSQYRIGKPVKSASDFPEIPVGITIDQDKGLLE